MLSEYYNVVEYFPQAPCAMSSIEVLQMFPAQIRNLLSVLGAMDPKNSNVIAFKLDDFKSRLSHQLTFQLSTKVIGKKIHRTVLDEGTSTSFMSLFCWTAVGSPKINCSPLTLKAFDGRGFQPYGLLSSLLVEVGGKLVSIHVEVIDAPLEYNLLLGRNWFCALQALAPSVFRVVQFSF